MNTTRGQKGNPTLALLEIDDVNAQYGGGFADQVSTLVNYCALLRRYLLSG